MRKPPFLYAHVERSVRAFRQSSIERPDRQRFLALSAFSDEQAAELALLCIEGLERVDAPHVVANCRGRTDREWLSWIAGSAYATTNDAARAAGDRLFASDETLVLVAPSTKRRGLPAADLVYDLIQDATLRRPGMGSNEPESEQPAGGGIIVIDKASFFESSFGRLGQYAEFEMLERRSEVPPSGFGFD